MQRLAIHPQLQSVIAEAFLTTNHNGETYHVLPGIYTVVGFQLSGRIDHVAENRSLSNLGVTGILETSRQFRSTPNTRSLLIFLKPGGFYRLFGGVAGALGSESLGMADVVPAPMHQKISGLLIGSESLTEKWQRVQHLFLQLLSRDLSPEAMGLLYHLETQQGRCRISSAAKELSVSPRTLERRFAAEIGTTPKHLARIMRWRHTMKNLRQFADFGSAAVANGYFDQAHFIRETHALAGTTPSELAQTNF